MSRAAAWRWCLAAGVIAFACSVGFGRIPGLVACGDAGGLGPILAFEFARTPADVAALFGTEPCRSTLVAAQRTGLLLDALGFIPSYTAFLCFAAWGVASRRGWPIVAGVLIAGLADEVEGGLLYAILSDLPGTPALLQGLFWAVHTKFLLLGLATCAIAALLVLTLRMAPVGFGIVAGFGAVKSVSAFLDADPATMMRGLTLGWTMLLLVAAIGAVGPRWIGAKRRVPASPSA